MEALHLGIYKEENEDWEIHLVYIFVILGNRKVISKVRRFRGNCDYWIN